VGYPGVSKRSSSIDELPQIGEILVRILVFSAFVSYAAPSAQDRRNEAMDGWMNNQGKRRNLSKSNFERPDEWYLNDNQGTCNFDAK